MTSFVPLEVADPELLAAARREHDIVVTLPSFFSGCSDTQDLQKYEGFLQSVFTSRDTEWKPFAEVREFARGLKLTSFTAWRIWWAENRPEGIPSNPYKIYKEWRSWGDFLGTGYMHEKEYLPFEEVRALARSLGLKNQKEWFFCWQASRPEGVPCGVEREYKDSGWKGWGDFLGTGNLSPQGRAFLTFAEARKFARSLKLKNFLEWNEWYKTNRPANIPSNPNVMYKDSGWAGYGDWLGTGNTKHHFRWSARALVAVAARRRPRPRINRERDQDAQAIRQMRSAGDSFSAIANLLGRSRSDIARVAAALNC